MAAKTEYEQALASWQGAISQAKGAKGEDIADLVLRSKGVRMVEKIATPVRIIARKRMHGSDWFRLAWGEKVSGDRMGILDGGRRVLAEVKTRDRNLRWKDLEDHQVLALTENAALGGLSLVVFVHPGGIAVLEWPIEGFGPGKGLTITRALELAWPGVVQ